MYLRVEPKHKIPDPVVRPEYVETIDPKFSHSITLNHTLMAPPTAPQVSGRVMHALVRRPRLIHPYRKTLVRTAQSIYNRFVSVVLLVYHGKNSQEDFCTEKRSTHNWCEYYNYTLNNA